MIITNSTYSGCFFGRNSVILDFRLSSYTQSALLTMNIDKISSSTGSLVSSSQVKCSLIPVTLSNNLYSYVCDLSGLLSTEGAFFYKITASAVYDASQTTTTLFSFNIFLFNAGVSKNDFNEDVLNDRYLDLPDSLNWLWSTRNGGSGVVSLYESEITDFYFVTNKYVGTGNVYTFLVEDTRGYVVGGATPIYISAAGMPQMRIYKVSLSNPISSNPGGVVNISYVRLSAGQPRTVISRSQVLVKNDPQSENKSLIYFRNSLGFLEALLCCGSCELTPEFTDGESFNYTDSNGVEGYGSKRSLVKESLILKTGYCDKNRALFVKDLLLSDESYILLNGAIRRCKVRCDNFSLHSDPVPISFDLNVDMIVEDANMSAVSFGIPLANESVQQLVITENNIPSIITLE